jgi:hypothetical protein
VTSARRARAFLLLLLMRLGLCRKSLACEFTSSLGYFYASIAIRLQETGNSASTVEGTARKRGECGTVTCNYRNLEPEPKSGMKEHE